MNILMGGPGSGKTKELLKLSMENNVPIVCESEGRVKRLLTKAEGYGYRIPIPVLYNELDDTISEVYVDDIERLLSKLLHCNVGAITLNITKTSSINKMEE